MCKVEFCGHVHIVCTHVIVRTVSVVGALGRPKRFLDGCGKQSASEYKRYSTLVQPLLDTLGQGRCIDIG